MRDVKIVACSCAAGVGVGRAAMLGEIGRVVVFPWAQTRHFSLNQQNNTYSWGPVATRGFIDIIKRPHRGIFACLERACARRSGPAPAAPRGRAWSLAQAHTSKTVSENAPPLLSTRSRTHRYRPTSPQPPCRPWGRSPARPGARWTGLVSKGRCRVSAPPPHTTAGPPTQNAVVAVVDLRFRHRCKHDDRKGRILRQQF